MRYTTSNTKYVAYQTRATALDIDQSNDIHHHCDHQVTMNNSYSNSMCETIPSPHDNQYETKPLIPVRNTKSIVSGTAGRTRKFTRIPPTEIDPEIYKISGSTAICVALVLAISARIPYCSGSHV
jgi:hypothetical protein